MTPTTTPNIADLTAEQLLALRSAIDGRLEEIKTAFREQGEALGLTFVAGNGKKQRRKPSKHHED